MPYRGAPQPRSQHTVSIGETMVSPSSSALGHRSSRSARTSSSSVSSAGSFLVRGERVLSKHRCVVQLSNRRSGFEGLAALTNHSLVFMRQDEGQGFNVPYGLMSKVGKGPQALSLMVSCRDVRDLYLIFSSKEEISKFSSGLRNAMREDSLSFPFQYSTDEDERNGWLVYDPVREFARLGLKSGDWRVSYINTSFKVVPSYPHCFGAPASVSDGDLVKAAGFRRMSRLPAVQWRHATNNSVLMRAGQPKVGLMGTSCEEDERIVRSAVSAMGNDGRLVHVFDCRTERSANAHWALLGGGREDGRKEAYGIGRYVFLNVHNASNQKVYHDEMIELAKPMTTKTLRNLRVMAAITASAWFQQISMIISGANDIASVLDNRKGSALVHCSDGMNRTTQLVALAQVLLDPYYRTLLGFEVLVEKEWLSMGHQFASRLGHRKDQKNMQAPIFLQWLECVWQIMQVAQTSFEFNEDLLLVVADAALTRRHGTFLFDSLKEAEEKKFRNRTVSLWTEVNAARAVFTHKAYRRREGMLRAVIPRGELQLWTKFYSRHADGDWPADGLLSSLAQPQDDILECDILAEAFDASPEEPSS